MRIEVFIENLLAKNFPYKNSLKNFFKIPINFHNFLFEDYEELARVRVRNPLKKKFYKPFPLEIDTEKRGDIKGVIYDGIELLKLANKKIPYEEDAIKILITARLISTFEAGRYHLRMIVMGPIALISYPGILYAPAKDERYYIKHAMGIGEDVKVDREKVLKMLFLQYIAFIVYGEIFCKNPKCMLHNCHTIREIENVVGLCEKHKEMMEKFIV